MEWVRFFQKDYTCYNLTNALVAIGINLEYHVRRKTISILKMNTSLFFEKYEYLQMGSGIPELENRVKKPSYGIRRHKTELSQISM